jgi:hypothetical protein
MLRGKEKCKLPKRKKPELLINISFHLKMRVTKRTVALQKILFLRINVSIANHNLRGKLLFFQGFSLQRKSLGGDKKNVVSANH